MIRIIFLLVVLVSGSSAYLPVGPYSVLPAPLPSAERIVGGVETNIKDNPYQVALLHKGAMGCGGSIVRPKAVVTAAHCTSFDTNNPYPLSDMHIRAGSSKHNFGGQVIQCSHNFRHELYSRDTADYDFAVLGLSSAIYFSELAAPIALASQGLVVPDGAPALASGWGQLAFEHGSPYPDVLHKVEISIVNQDYCFEEFRKVDSFVITKRMICAGGSGQSVCFRDSGGPLVVDNSLVGIASFAFLCGKTGLPAGWARVSEVRDWFDDKLSQIVSVTGGLNFQQPGQILKMRLPTRPHH